MVKFPGLYKEFIQFKDCTLIKRPCGIEIWICPNCKKHKQEDCDITHDCKEIIYDNELDKDGRLQGGNTQCGCYSKEHGLRRG